MLHDASRMKLFDQNFFRQVAGSPIQRDIIVTIMYDGIRDSRRDPRHRDNCHGPRVYIRLYLGRTYGKGRWRKRKGRATVQFANGTVGEAEIHWFEVHGVGRKDF